MKVKYSISNFTKISYENLKKLNKFHKILNQFLVKKIYNNKEKSKYKTFTFKIHNQHII